MLNGGLVKLKQNHTLLLFSQTFFRKRRRSLQREYICQLLAMSFIALLTTFISMHHFNGLVLHNNRNSCSRSIFHVLLRFIFRALEQRFFSGEIRFQLDKRFLFIMSNMIIAISDNVLICSKLDLLSIMGLTQLSNLYDLVHNYLTYCAVNETNLWLAVLVGLHRRGRLKKS